MDRFLLFCHNKRPSYELDFIIEEPLMTYLQKKFHIAVDALGKPQPYSNNFSWREPSHSPLHGYVLQKISAVFG